MENRKYYNKSSKADKHDYKKMAIEFIQKWMPEFYTTCRCGELNSREIDKCMRCGTRL